MLFCKQWFLFIAHCVNEKTVWFQKKNQVPLKVMCDLDV